MLTQVYETSLDDLDEDVFFAQDKAHLLGHRKISHALGIGLKNAAIDLVGGETVAGDQTPGDIIAAFVQRELARQMAAAARE